MKIDTHSAAALAVIVGVPLFFMFVNGGGSASKQYSQSATGVIAPAPAKKKAEEVLIAPPKETEKKAEPVITPSSSRSTDDVLTERLVRKVNARWGNLIREAAVAHDLDWRDLLTLVVVESKGDPNALSRSGAKGLTQLKPGAAMDVGVKNPYNPRQSIFGGARYLSILRSQGCEMLGGCALAYHDGTTGARRFLRSGGEVWEHHYVKKVRHTRFAAGKVS